MSKRRKKAGANSRGADRARAAGSFTRKMRSRGRAALWMAGLILAGLGAWFIWKQSARVELPDVPLARLDATVSNLIQSHIEGAQADPQSGRAWGQLGAVLKSFGFREEAEHCLAIAERLEPKEPRWPYLQAALRSDDTAFALARLRRTVALCGNDPEMPRLRLARLLAETGQENEARGELGQLLRARPNSGPARILMAQICQSQGDWDAAFSLASGSTTNPHTARTAWTMLSALHRRRGDTNAALLAARRAAGAAPDAAWPDPFEEEVLAWRNDPRSLSDRAQNYLLAGRAAEALPLVNQLVREHPDFPETWLLLGRARNLQNQPAAAEQSLRRFLELDPQSVNGYFQLGMSLLAQKRYPEAAAIFRHAITLKRDFGPAFFNLGFALAKSGQQPEAIPAFQEAIRQNPEKIDAYILLADLHLQSGETGKAIQLAALAETLDPADPRVPALRRKIERQ